MKKNIRIILGVVVGLVGMIGAAIWPGLPVSAEDLQQFALPVILYIFAEGIEGPRALESIMQLLKSRKFMLLVAGAVVAFLPDFPLLPEQLASALVWFVQGLFGSVSLGFGVESVLDRLKIKG